jgi:hypothetical protein
MHALGQSIVTFTTKGTKLNSYSTYYSACFFSHLSSSCSQGEIFDYVNSCFQSSTYEFQFSIVKECGHVIVNIIAQLSRYTNPEIGFSINLLRIVLLVCITCQNKKM